MSVTTTNSTRRGTAGSRQGAAPAAARRGAFTLIEILIVVIIIGILAGIVVPQFTSVTAEARQAMVRDELRLFRNQLIVFRAQHRDVNPGYPGGDPTAAPTEAAFVDHLTKYTSRDGDTSDTGGGLFVYPPYLEQIPENPVTRKNGVWVVTSGTAIPAADESKPYGWIYNPLTGTFAVNLEGSDLRNVPFAKY